MQKKFLNYLKIYRSVPIRTAKKWLYILKSCWNNIFDQQTFIGKANFYLSDDTYLTMSLMLPPVESNSSPFIGKSFIITLNTQIISYDKDIYSLLGMELYDIFILFKNEGDDLFEILFTLKDKIVKINSKEIFINSLYKKDGDNYKMVY